MRISSEPRQSQWQFLLIALLLATGHEALAKSLNIFTCEPEWAALAHQLAPDAHIFSATSDRQDPHQVQARPSLIAKMRQADLAVCSGASLEVGWLPALQMKSANPVIQSGKPGMFFAAEQVVTIDPIEHINPTMGDVHPEGNPHLHLDPYRIEQVAKALSQRLVKIDPNGTSKYQTRFTQFSQQWQPQIKQWEKQASTLKGMKVIAYHSSFNYLFRWLGIDMVGDLEPKPGLPPSPAHLAALLKDAQNQKVDAIIYNSYQDGRGARWLGEKTGAPVIQLPFSVHQPMGKQPLTDLFDQLITSLLTVRSHDKP